MHAIQFKQPRALPGLYSPRFTDFVFRMLEKKMTRRPFILDIFEMFPSKLELTKDTDLRNL